ncbi:hypothetical protein LCGC14_2896880, partial [marine sediment metagenome]
MTDVALDSGAYSIDSGSVSGKNLTIEKYAEYVKKEGDRYTIRFTFDKIGHGPQSYKNWLWLRKQELDIIPVYHLGTDEKYLERYLRQVDYISLGGIANMHRGELMKGLRYIWKKYLLDQSGNPICKLHGLGITSYNVMAAFPWYTVDSTSANIRAAYGTILLPQKLDKSGKEDMSKPWHFVSLSNRKGKRTEVATLGSNQSLYYMWPQDLQAQFRKYIESWGFELGQFKPGEFVFGKPEEHIPLDLKVHTSLTDSPYTRTLWNARFMQRWIDQNGTAKIYHVIGTHLAESMGNMPILIS